MLKSPADITIPGTATLCMSEHIENMFGPSQEILQVHLEPLGEWKYLTRTYSESVQLIVERLLSLPEEWPATIQAHSYGTKLLMKACIMSPQILTRLKTMRLLAPPCHHLGLANQFEKNEWLARILKRRYPYITFTPEYVQSLRIDTARSFREFYEFLAWQKNIPKVHIFPVYQDAVLWKIHPETYLPHWTFPYWDSATYSLDSHFPKWKIRILQCLWDDHSLAQFSWNSEGNK